MGPLSITMIPGSIRAARSPLRIKHCAPSTFPRSLALLLACFRSRSRERETESEEFIPFACDSPEPSSTFVGSQLPRHRSSQQASDQVTRRHMFDSFDVLTKS
ncbi:hypothetical protein BT93_E2037 [Corymbia citriodora subsp. variegata]|nr:hypothetical protein BT93_E2037 [Corymbia citriodora subsp. variegata]